MNAEVDVRQLAIDRGSPQGPGARRPRHLVSRYVLPGAVLLGFLLVAAWAARDSLLPSTPVTVVPVVVTRAEVRQAGAPLFQAPGWVEPRPTPVLVSALAEGVVEELLVVEGQDIEADQPVARLVETDARLALDQAQADLQLKEAEATSARAELTAARSRFEQPVHLEAAVAEADYLLAQKESELAKLPFDVRAAEARLRLAQQELEGKQASGLAVAGRLVQRAQTEVDSATSHVEELRRRDARLKREIEALTRKRDAQNKQLELKIEETRGLAEAEANVKAAQARVRQATSAVAAAQLRLDRMVVRAPVAGRVLKLGAEPGKRVVGLSPHSLYDSSTVVSLYDPKMLQVRCDVRLEDVPLVQPGQSVRIETASASGPIEGEVLMVTSSANIQKNTLEVKVAIKDPPTTIRPEMLVQATFLAPEKPGSDAEATEQQQRLLIPRSLVDKTSDGSFVWIADASETARRARVKLGNACTEELVEVVEGLKATDKLISGGRESVSPDERIRIVGEDSSLGVTALGTSPDAGSSPEKATDDPTANPKD